MQAEIGWRACTKCNGLANINAPGNVCADQGVHDIDFSPDSRVWVGDMPPGVAPDLGLCSRCARLASRAGNSKCWGGAPHSFEEFSPPYGLAMGVVAGATHGWRVCDTCGSVYNAGVSNIGCVDGGLHTFSASPEFSVPFVPFGLRERWDWCEGCQGLALPFTGFCHDGEPHRSSGLFSFSLAYGIVPVGTQGGFRVCVNCSMVTLSKSAAGACYAASGGPHELSDGLVYSIPAGTVRDDASPGWRVCAKCALVGFTQVEVGPCPAGEQHDYESSEAYSLYPVALRNGQPGWRKCGRCSALTFTQLTGGVCRGGGPHDVAKSNSYSVPLGQPPEGGESSWRLCSRCQVLVSQAGQSPGVCFDSGPHDLTDSPLYGLARDEPPERPETGWRRCRTCQELAFSGGQTLAGLCIEGGPHDFTDSPEYSLTVEKIAGQPSGGPAATGPRLTMIEGDASIVAQGAGFTAGIAVELSFVLGAKTVTQQLMAGADGSFELVITEITATDTGALVRARQADGRSASGRLTSFVPSTLVPPP